MTVIEFIKEFGWEESIRIYNNLREVVNQTPYKHSLEDFSIELKLYVEAYELVKAYGGTDKSKTFLKSEYRKISTPTTYNNLKQAIKLVEEI